MDEYVRATVRERRCERRCEKDVVRKTLLRTRCEKDVVRKTLQESRFEKDISFDLLLFTDKYSCQGMFCLGWELCISDAYVFSMLIIKGKYLIVSI